MSKPSALPPVSRIALALALVVASSDAVAQRARYTRDVLRDTVLENGLQIIAIRNPTSPMATAVVVIRGGAMTQESEAVAGIPHYIEHLLFKTRSSWGSEMASVDGGSNGSTSEESVQYFVTAPGKNAPQVVQSLAALVRSPKFNEKDMSTEMNVVRNEIERLVGDPRFLMDFAVAQELWGASATRKNVGGNVFALRQATPKSLEELYKTNYTPNRAALVVSGDIDLTAVVAAAVGAFKGWKKGPPDAGPAFAVAPLTATRVLPPLDGVGNEVVLQIAWHGPSAQADPVGAASASLVVAALNNSNSDFQRELVDNGLFQSVTMSYDLLNNVGPIKIVARTTGSQLAAATTALQTQLARLGSPQAFGDDELRLARKYWSVASALDWESGSSFALSAAETWSIGGLSGFIGQADQIAARSSDDLRGFMLKYITGRPKVVAAMISREQVAALGRSFSATMLSWNGR
jgi:predicted Zn-dependent peptidase